MLLRVPVALYGHCTMSSMTTSGKKRPANLMIPFCTPGGPREQAADAARHGRGHDAR